MTEQVNAGDSHLSPRGGGEEETDKPKDTADSEKFSRRKVQRQRGEGMCPPQGKARLMKHTQGTGIGGGTDRLKPKPVQRDTLLPSTLPSSKRGEMHVSAEQGGDPALQGKVLRRLQISVSDSPSRAFQG